MRKLNLLLLMFTLMAMLGCQSDNPIENEQGVGISTDSVYTYQGMCCAFEVPLTDGVEVREMGPVDVGENRALCKQCRWFIYYKNQPVVEINANALYSNTEKYDFGNMCDNRERDSFWQDYPATLSHWYNLGENKAVFYHQNEEKVLVNELYYYGQGYLSVQYLINEYGDETSDGAMIAKTIVYPQQTFNTWFCKTSDLELVFLFMLVIVLIVLLCAMFTTSYPWLSWLGWAIALPALYVITYQMFYMSDNVECAQWIARVLTGVVALCAIGYTIFSHLKRNE